MATPAACTCPERPSERDSSGSLVTRPSNQCQRPKRTPCALKPSTTASNSQRPRSSDSAAVTSLRLLETAIATETPTASAIDSARWRLSRELLLGGGGIGAAGAGGATAGRL